jgi:hypothetical protein
MMSYLLRRTLKVGPVVGCLVASAVGCFVFTRGFQLIAKDGEESDMGSPLAGHWQDPKLLAGWTRHSS